MIVILKNEGSILKPLKDLLVEKGHNVIITNNTTKIKSPDLLIRWGNTEDLSGRNNIKRTLNSVSGIRLASNKLKALETMSKSGILVPKFSKSPSGIKLPVLGRSRYHTKGTDIKLIMQKRDVELYASRGETIDYYTEYIRVKREFRVHVFRNSIIGVNRKLYTNSSLPFIPYIRNLSTGFTFESAGNEKIQDKIGEIAIKAVKSLGLDFGAVDIIRSEDDNYYVLEVNTAPGLSTSHIRYGEAIHNYIMSEN